jgi:hypothetical protein
LAGTPVPKKRGPRFKFDWSTIESEARRLLDRHGDFSPHKRGWDAQARLESALQEFCSEKYDKEPSLTQIRTHVGKWLSAWRNARK